MYFSKMGKPAGVVVCALMAASLGACAYETEPLDSIEAALAPTATFQQGVNGYSGTTDAKLDSFVTTRNFGESITCTVGGGRIESSCLLRWDISSIPTNATVTDVEIKIEATNASTATFSVTKLLVSWKESETTWLRRSGPPELKGLDWAAPGAKGRTDRDGRPLGTLAGGLGAQVVAFNALGIATVQQWVSTPSKNYGVAISNTVSEDNLVFRSSEATTGFRPELRVWYTVP